MAFYTWQLYGGIICFNSGKILWLFAWGPQRQTWAASTSAAALRGGPTSNASKYDRKTLKKNGGFQSHGWSRSHSLVSNTKTGLMTWMIWEVPPVWESSRRGCASAKAAKAAVSSQDGTCVGLLGCSHVPKLRLFHCREGKTNDQKHSKAHSCFSLGSTFWSMLTSKCVSQHWSKDCVKMDGPWRSRCRRSAFVAWPSLDDLVSWQVCPEQFQPYHMSYGQYSWLITINRG